MAVLTTAQLEIARRRMAAGVVVTWRKAQINAALQAIENVMTGALGNVGPRTVPQEVSRAIEADAESTGVFNAGQKDTLFLLWSDLNRMRGGIL